MTRRRLDLRATAEVLGTSVDAVRKRIARGTLDSEKVDGKVYVWLDPPLDDGAPRSDTDRLISTLEEQLALEREAHAEARRLLAAALERIPALEPPEVPESASEPVATTETPQEPAEQKPHKEEPSPPQGQDSSDSTLREGAQRGILVAPRPRWRQIGVAVLLAGMITTIPQLI